MGLAWFAGHSPNTFAITDTAGGRIQVIHTLGEAPEGWKGEEGFIDMDKINRFVTKPNGVKHKVGTTDLSWIMVKLSPPLPSGGIKTYNVFMFQMTYIWQRYAWLLNDRTWSSILGVTWVIWYQMNLYIADVSCINLCSGQNGQYVWSLNICYKCCECIISIICFDVIDISKTSLCRDQLGNPKYRRLDTVFVWYSHWTVFLFLPVTEPQSRSEDEVFSIFVLLFRQLVCLVLVQFCTYNHQIF